jgi:hypothetical protein
MSIKEFESNIRLSDERRRKKVKHKTTYYYNAPHPSIKSRSPSNDSMYSTMTVDNLVVNRNTVLRGLVDPPGLEFEPVAANPGNVKANTLWLSNSSGILNKGASPLVLGPASTTDKALSAFSGTGGNVISASGITISGAGNNDLNNVGNISLAGGGAIATTSNDITMGGDTPSTTVAPTQNATSGYIRSYQTLIGEPTGMPALSRTNTTLAITSGTVSPVITLGLGSGVTSYDYYISGRKFTKTAATTITLTNATEGLHYIVLDSNGALVDSPIYTKSIYKDYVFVCEVYWDASNLIPLLFGDDRHEFMPWQCHYDIEMFHGTTYEYGLALNSITADGSSSSNASCTFGVDTGSILDEDISHNINAITAPANVFVFYRDTSARWRAYGTGGGVAQGAPIVKGTQNLYYNPATTGGLVEVTNGNYVLSHIFATNSYVSNKKVIAIMGQFQYDNISNARAAALTEVNNLILTGLPAYEGIFIGTIIYESIKTYSNSWSAIIRSTATGGKYVNLLYRTFNPTNAPSTHGNLAGLLIDNHPQYQLTASVAPVDNTIVRWDGTSGRSTQGSGIIIDDSNNMSAVASMVFSASGGATITKFSTDGTLASNSDSFAPTEKAVKTYVDNRFSSGTHTTNWSGIWSTAQSGNIKYTTAPGSVTLTLPDLTVSATTSGVIVNDTPLSIGLRPIGSNRRKNIIIIDAEQKKTGMIIIATNGVITISTDVSGSNFTGTGMSGFYSSDFTYNI